MSGELSATFAALPRTTRGQSIVLGGKEDKKTFLYTHGTNVYIRNIEDPAVCDVYADHNQQTTVAKYSPSGFYIASADVHGKIRIWDTVNIEHILKNEFIPFAGPVKDLDWSGDSQRIVAGGEGREKFAHVFSADTGTSVGEIIGHSKAINSVAFKSTRPFRIVTASEDQTLCFYHGPPFKFNLAIEEHKNFVNAVRYSPDGNKFVSGGSDGKAYVFDGKTGEKLLELGSPAHKAGIYGVAFSPNNAEVLTVSGDKTAKIFNAETGECVVEFTLGSNLNDMQLGCLWQGEHILTVSLSGHINYLDRNNPSTPMRVIMGHNKQINSLVTDGDVIYSADSDGKICVWNANDGSCLQVSGEGHKAQVQGISLNGDKLYSCSIDDTMREIDVNNKSYTDTSVKMSSQPQAIATSPDGYAVIACLNEIMLLQNGRMMCNKPVKFSPSSVAIHPNQTEVAVGGQDSSVYIFSMSGGNLEQTKSLKQTGAISCLAYSPDGAYLAAGDANRKVALYRCPEYENLVSNEWTAHTAKVLCLAWSPNSQYIASGSLDTHIIIWDTNNKDKKIKIERAHRMSAVSAVSWRNDNQVVSAGHDANIRLWNIKF